MQVLQSEDIRSSSQQGESNLSALAGDAGEGRLPDFEVFRVCKKSVGKTLLDEEVEAK